MARDWRDVFDLGDHEAPEPPPEEAPVERRGLFKRLRENLGKSRRALQAELSASLFETLDNETWERLEEALILADVGAPTTAEVVGKLEMEVESGEVGAGEPLRERLIELLAETA
jgi:fused signal recognition particle receptor